MSPHINCFQIKGSELVPGIPFSARVIGQRLPIETLADLGNQARVFCGRPVIHKGSRRRDNHILGFSTAREADADYSIVYFEVPDLNFGEPLLEGLNFWPGGGWGKKIPALAHGQRRW